MKDIKRIVIKGSSGYVPVEYAYEDKVTITPGSIAYEFKPYQETTENPSRKWKYQSNTPEFQEQFKTITESLQKVLAAPPDIQILDVGKIDFEITYIDQTKERMISPLISGWFHDLFMDIKMMVPFSEMIPPTLWTEEDEEEYED